LSQLFAFFEYWITAVSPAKLPREHPGHPLNHVNVVIASDVSIDISGEERDQLNRLLARFEKTAVGRAE
jgi:hypothetical protein